MVEVRPEQVVEIAFDGLQRSTRYPGGVALRFARVLRYRDDKGADEADTIATVQALAPRAPEPSPARAELPHEPHHRRDDADDAPGDADADRESGQHVPAEGDVERPDRQIATSAARPTAVVATSPRARSHAGSGHEGHGVDDDDLRDGACGRPGGCAGPASELRQALPVERARRG